MSGPGDDELGDDEPDGIGLRSRRGPVLVGIMLCTSLVALEATVIATAVPSIVRDLGGFSQFPWLFSVFLLTQAVTVPLYGKLADVVGRRPVLTFGIAAFLVGSLLCGLAWTMPLLIVARGIQGIGAGAILPMTVTIAGDLFTVAERARVQGYIASVWGVSAVVGPLIGGVFSEYLHWRWIFLVNLPLGVLAAWMLLRVFTEQVRRAPHRFDIAGAVLLVTACSALILGLLEGGVAWAWRSPASAVVFAVAAVALAGFVVAERRAAEPILPPWVVSRRVLVGGNLASAAVGVVLIGLTSYVPTFVQGVLGTGPLLAGFAVATMTIGWPISAALSGRLYLRIGFRDTAIIGSVVVLAGTALLTRLGPSSSVAEVGAFCFVVGVGLGLTSAPTVVAVQSVVDWQHRGVVTGANLFSRNVGSAVGVAVFGALATATLTRSLAAAPADLAGRLPEAADAGDLLLRGELTSEAVAAAVRAALSDATHTVLVAVAVAAVAIAAALWLMPRRTTPITPR